MTKQKAAQQAEVSFPTELREAFVQYGVFVNYNRALPDVRDGLIPVHRHILYGMWDNKGKPEDKLGKAAKHVGHVIGTFHPHGDTALYGAMVNMAQPWKRLHPLIETQGNWGSLTDPAAAYRYTECKLNAAAAALLGRLPDSGSAVSEISEDSVDFVPNYNGETSEPVVLPALFPSAVVNGFDNGIGVGIASNAAPHNLNEVMRLALHMVDTPNVQYRTVSKLLPGPDVPADCDVFDTDGGGIEQYLTSGYGGFIMRARWTVEQYKSGTGRGATTGHRIVVTGLPLGVSTSHVVDGVRQLVELELLPPVSTENYGEDRLVLDIGTADPDDTVQRLLYNWKRSRLQANFSVNMNMIHEGRIQMVSPVDAVRIWLDHRRECIHRRTVNRLAKAEERLHIVLGFLKAIPIAREIVELVQDSDDRADASTRMQERWGFSEVQAGEVLDMSVVRLTKLGVARFEDERSQLEAAIAEFTDIINNPSRLDSVLKDEIRSVSKTFGMPRRSALRDGSGAVTRPDTPAVEVPEVKYVLAVTGRNWVRRLQRAGSTNRATTSDAVEQYLPVTNYNRFAAVTSSGYLLMAPVMDVPQNLVNGKAVFNDFLNQGTELVLVGSGAPYGLPDIVLVTASGKLKRVACDNWSARRDYRPFQLIGTDADDPVSTAFFLPDGHDIAVVTAHGKLVMVESSAVLPKGGAARGVPGARLDGDGDSVAWAGSVSAGTELVYWTTANGIGRFSVTDVGYSNRGTRGRPFTTTKSLVRGARTVPEGTTFVEWFSQANESPRSLALGLVKSGTSLRDRSLGDAENIGRAVAVWTTNETE